MSADTEIAHAAVLLQQKGWGQRRIARTEGPATGWAPSPATRWSPFWPAVALWGPSSNHPLCGW